MKTFSPLVRLVEQPSTVRRGGKSAQAFRTISEVAQELDVPQHVLRFWETKFTQIRPLKRGGGRRYYRPDDVALLQSIHKLLHHDGYTIKGVQRLLREAIRPGVSRSTGERGAPEAGEPATEAADLDDAETTEAANYSMLDLLDEAAEGVAEEGDLVPLLPVLSSEKRALLKSVLAELEELRALIPSRSRWLAS